MNPFVLALMTAGIFVFVTKLNKYQDNKAERKRISEPEETSTNDTPSNTITQAAGLGRYHEQAPYGLQPADDQATTPKSNLQSSVE